MRHLDQIRSYELYKSIAHLPKSGRLLEIGAGTGWQAKLLSDANYDVAAIDIFPHQNKSCPVIIYNGKDIPFPSDTFDVLFSSNTLEHIKNIDSFLKETRRVVKDDGIALHVLPTPYWRLWTSCSHYIKMMTKALSLISNNLSSREPKKVFENPSTKNNGTINLALRIIFPPRHGERGNALSEIFLYRKKWWKKTFEEAGWHVVETFPLQLFYTGNSVLGNKLSIAKRCSLSKILGSSTTGYILKKSEHPQTKT